MTRLSINCNSIRLGAAWDYSLINRTDFDLSLVLCDRWGNELDAIFYNNLNYMDGAIIHTGDNRSGEGDGDDESIIINLTQIIDVFSMFVFITAHEGGDSKHQAVGKFTLYNDHNILHSKRFTSAKNDNACLVGCIYRQGDHFEFAEINRSGKGRNFNDAKYLMEDEIPKFYTPDKLRDRICNLNRVYSLSKGGIYVFNRDLKTITLGLGWDPSPHYGNIDVDASVAMFDQNCANIGTVYFGRREAYNGAIKHSGDNLTGDGDGEDERITIELNRLPQQVSYIVACVSIYSGATSFSAIQKCFALIRDQSGKELCHYNLSGNYTTRAVIIGAIHRRETGLWAFECMGDPASGRTISSNLHDITTCLHQLKNYYDLPAGVPEFPPTHVVPAPPSITMSNQYNIGSFPPPPPYVQTQMITPEPVFISQPHVQTAHPNIIDPPASIHNTHEYATTRTRDMQYNRNDTGGCGCALL